MDRLMTFKISTKMFSSIDKTFDNNQFISKDCNHAIPS